MNAMASIDGSEQLGVPMLSPLEWRVVSLALREAGEMSCTGEPSRLRRWLRGVWSAITGWEPRRPLADPRLEMLRRFVCTARGRRDAADIAARLIGMGFTRSQLAAVTLLVRR